MIKLLIFDLDGTLINTGDIHFEALNKAISKYGEQYLISKEEDSRIFGTVPSKKKLKILSKLKNFPKEYHNDVLDLKKKYTEEIIDSIDVSKVFENKVLEVLSDLKSDGYQIYIASNTNKDFISKILNKTGLKNLVDVVISNNDVLNAKPNSEMYLKCMLRAGVSPNECIIFEDSVTGQEAALNSGAHLFPVESMYDVDYESISNFIKHCNLKTIPKWHSKKINVVIPCAGQGSRFVNAGYKLPKPIIDVNGTPMVGLVAEKLNIEANFIFIIRGEHATEYNLEVLLKAMKPGCTVVKTYGKQQGAVDSILKAESLINNDEHLLIVNSDQIWEWNSREFYYQMIREDLDGGIVTFVDDLKDPKWSFAKINDQGFVTEVAEKKPISNLATAGIYFFKKGSDFVKYSHEMIKKDIRVNNEFYTCPVFNEFIEDGKKIKTFNCTRMIGLGIPEDLENYLTNG